MADKINVASSVTLSFDLINGYLTNPSLHLLYTQLSTHNGAVTPTTAATQVLNFSIVYNYSLASFWTGCIAGFIVVSILALAHAIGKTYVNYLNRKTPLLIFLNFLGTWSLWMFYFLLIITGYWFLFTKTTTSVVALMPQDSSFYIAFYIVVGATGLFRLIGVVIDKMDKLNT